jgi:hypothetical protein
MRLPRNPLGKRPLMFAAFACALVFMAAVSGSQQERSAHLGTEAPVKAVPPAPAHIPGPAERKPAGTALDDESRLPLELLNRRDASGEAVNLFATRTWYVPPPPPPPPKPAPPPKPTAPPLPFTFLGQYAESPEHVVFFLVKGDKVYTVSAGDVVDGTYRIEGVSGGQLALIYLPLNTRQLLSTGGSS